MPKNPQLFHALKAAGPARSWDLMRELRDLDQPGYAAGSQAETDEIVRDVESFMRLVPGLDRAEIAAHARALGGYGPRLQFESYYLSLWMDDTKALLGGVVEEVGLAHLAAAQDEGRGVLLLPFHVGPSYATIGVVAHRMPLTTLFNHMNFQEIKDVAFPDLDFDGMQLGTDNAVRTAISVLRQKRAFCMFPEMDPRGVDDRHIPVDFFGRPVHAPAGPATTSFLAKAPMVCFAATLAGDGHFQLRYYPPIAAPGCRDDIIPATHRIWSQLQEELGRGNVGEWEMWHEFDRIMLPDAPVGV